MAVIGATVFWLFYRPTPDDANGSGHRPTSDDPRGAGAETMHGGGSRSAFLSPVVWMIALIVGLGGFGQFTVTYFVPSVAKALYGLDAAAAGVIISTGYLTAIVVNLGVGLLADRFNKLVVLGLVFIILCVASASLAVENLVTVRVATATVIGFGFTAANQLYGLAGVVMPRHEAGHAMGVVSLGAGLFGYFGPQMLGILRDLTGSFAAGFYMVAIADLLTLTLIAALYRMTRGATHI
jgi:cyanate permease